MPSVNPVPGSSIQVHVFDVDGPLYDGDIDVDFAQYLSKKGLFDPKAAARMVGNVEGYSRGRIGYKSLAEQAIGLFALGVMGRSEAEILREARIFTKKYAGRFYGEGIRFLKRLRASAGVRIGLLSTSPKIIISAIGSALAVRLDSLYGSEYGVRKGRFTGKPLTGDIVEYKRIALGKIAKGFGVPKTKMVFYGNSVTDLHSAGAAGVSFRPMRPSKELEKLWALAKSSDGRRAIKASSRPAKVRRLRL